MRRYHRCRKVILELCYCLCGLALVFPGAFAQQPSQDKVTANDVLIRTGPGTEHSYIGRLYQGMTVRILKEQGEWCQIELPTQRFSWVKKDLLNTTGSATAEVQASAVYIRTGPGTEFNELGRVDTGFKVKLIRELEGWCLVTPAEATGWVSARYLEQASKNQPPRPPAVPEKLTLEEARSRFEQAGQLFAQVISKPVEEWNFDQVKKLCQEVAQKCDDTSLKLAASSMLEDIQEAEKLVRRQADYQKKLQEINRKYQEELTRIRAQKLPSFYLAKGKIEKLTIDYLPPATHKLLVDNKIAYILCSEKVTLDDYTGKLVGIKGSVEKSRAFDVPIIKVDEVEVLQQPAGK